MPPVLVLLNGLPGSGKSTLARAWCDEHAAGLPLALDVDVLRSMLGGWQDRLLDAGLAARALALAAIAAHLKAGRDVVVPQFLRRPEFADALARTAADAGAHFLHCCLEITTSVAAERLDARAGGAEGALEQPLEVLDGQLDAFLTGRPEVVHLPSADGDVVGLDRLIADLRDPR